MALLAFASRSVVAMLWVERPSNFVASSCKLIALARAKRTYQEVRDSSENGGMTKSSRPTGTSRPLKPPSRACRWNKLREYVPLRSWPRLSKQPSDELRVLVPLWARSSHRQDSSPTTQSHQSRDWKVLAS